MMRTRPDNAMGPRIGSIILETAITAPVFLLLGAFMLTAISCARADILFSCAVDQVTQELSVAVPIAGAGIDLAGEALEYINSASPDTGGTQTDTVAAGVGQILTGAAGGIGAILEEFGIEGGDVLGTLLFGEGIRNRIVNTFASYNSSETLLHSRIQNVSVYVDYDASGKVIWLYVYYQWNTLFGPADKSIVSAVPIFGDLELTLPVTKTETTQEDKVWLLGNFERGLTLRTAFGSNLPVSYPVIAIWDNGTAASIKSVDLTAPGYQSAGSLTANVEEFIDELSGFDGTEEPWGKDGIQIESGQISGRVLILIIPENSPPEVYNEMMSNTIYANTKGVEIRIENYGNSYRYTDKQDSVTAASGENTGDNVPQ